MAYPQSEKPSRSVSPKTRAYNQMAYPQSKDVKIITSNHVENAKPAAPGTRYFIRERSLPGFALRVTDTGARSYVAVRRIGAAGNPAYLKIDRASLAEARDVARDWLNLMAAGRDPREVEATAKAEAKRAVAQVEGNTFAARWALYDKKHVTTLKPSSQIEVRRPYRVYFERAFGARPLESIRRGEISDVLNKIAAPVAANRAYGVIRAFLAWCLRKGYLDADPSPREAPNPKAEKERARVLTDAELKALWAADLPFPFGPYLKMLLLTGQRRGEVVGMLWGEIKGNDWHIPAERTKAGRATVVPLSAPALAVLAGLPRLGPFVFALSEHNHVKDHSNIKARIDRASGVADWRIHDIRRTVATGLERLGFAYETRAAVLNHSKSAREGVTAIYSRHNYAAEKRHALEAWAAFLDGLVNPAPDNIVRLGTARAG